MSDLVLTVYRDDDTTPYFEVGTAAAHPNPYLLQPTTFAEAEIEPREGKARIGRIQVRIADPEYDHTAGARRAGVDQTERFLTALLGDPEGYSLLNGRRYRLAHATGELVQDGVCAGVKLGGYAGFELSLEDIRARGIQVPAFRRTGTSTVFPRGVLDGYGALPAGGWLVPPTEPVQGVALREGANPWALINLQGSWKDPRGSAVTADWVYTDAMDRVNHSVLAPHPSDDSKHIQRWPQLSVLWRYPGDVAWTEVSQLSSYTGEGYHTRVLLPHIRARLDERDGDQVSAVSLILISDVLGAPVLPDHGRTVEVIVRYWGPATEDYPFHYEGAWGTFARNLLRGDYSAEEDGTALDPRIRYDEALLTDADGAFNLPVRIRQTEEVEDLREYFEDLCRAIGAAPALNAAGEIAPVLSTLPGPDEVLPQLDDTNCVAIPGWEHPITGAVTVVRATYPRDFRMPPEEDPRGQRSGGDGVATVEQPVVAKPRDPAVLAVMGEQEHKVDAFCFRALAGEEGQPVTGDVKDEAGYQHTLRLADQLIDRLAYGGQSSFVRAMRSDPAVEALRAGDWVVDARSWGPNYATGLRGRNHLVQILSIRDLNPAWREMRLLDAAPYANPLAQPTIAAPAADADGVVSVEVTALPEGECRVDYAISAVEPLPSSALWTFLGRTASLGTLESPRLPAGSTVWIRARAEAVGRRPSAWTLPQSVATPATPRVLRALVTLDEDTVVVLGRVNGAAAGVRVYYGVHRPSEDPGTLTRYQDFDASDGTWELAGVEVRPGEAITVEVEPWTGWDGAAVTGTAGEPVEAAGQRAADADAFRILAVNLVGSTEEERTYEVTAGAAVTYRDVHWLLWDGELPDDYLAQLYDASALKEILTSDGDTFTAPNPAEGQVLAYAVIPRAAAGDDLEVIGDGWDDVVPGGDARLEFDVDFTEATDGMTGAVDVRPTDPRGVVSGIDLYITEGTTTSGPYAMLLSAGVYSYGFTLPEKPHVATLRLVVHRSDGQPDIALGPYTSDSNKRADIGMPVVTPDGPQCEIRVDAHDTDVDQVVVQRWNGVAYETPAGWSGPPTDGIFLITGVTLPVGSPTPCQAYGLNPAGHAGPIQPFPLPTYTPPAAVPTGIEYVTFERVDGDGPVPDGTLDDQFIVSPSYTGTIDPAEHRLHIKVFQDGGGIPVAEALAHDPTTGPAPLYHTAQPVGTKYHAWVQLYRLSNDGVVSEITTRTVTKS